MYRGRIVELASYRKLYLPPASLHPGPAVRRARGGPHCGAGAHHAPRGCTQSHQSAFRMPFPPPLPPPHGYLRTASAATQSQRPGSSGGLPFVWINVLKAVFGGVYPKLSQRGAQSSHTNYESQYSVWFSSKTVDLGKNPSTKSKTKKITFSVKKETPQTSQPARFFLF